MARAAGRTVHPAVTASRAVAPVLVLALALALGLVLALARSDRVDLAPAAAGPAPAASGSSEGAPATRGARTGTGTGTATPAASLPVAVVPDGPAGPTYPTVPGATPDAPFVAFVGDSWTAGTGATGRIGYAPLTGRLLGWRYRVLGVPGSGYVQGGAGDVTFGERIAPALAGDPDVVVVQGSINERGTPAAELSAAVGDTLSRTVAAAGPDTVVVVLGASHVPGVPARSVDAVNAVLRAQTARLGLRFVDVAAEGWSDPADPSVWRDRYHVDDSGAQQVAERLAPLLRALVPG